MISNIDSSKLIQSSLLLILLCWSGVALTKKFDHGTTSFSLTGQHETLDCQECHINALFKGTPSECEFCHSNTGIIDATFKSPDHLMTNNRCVDCHLPVGWDMIARFEHLSSIGSCDSCHNNIKVEGKSSSHISSTQQCELCHIDSNWQSTFNVDHLEVFGSCSSCHNGNTASGKNPQHILSTETCESCHSTLIWSQVTRVDHSKVLGSCSTCHDGNTATGKVTGHFITSLECDACHTIQSWISIDFTHSGSYPGEHNVRDGDFD